MGWAIGGALAAGSVLRASSRTPVVDSASCSTVDAGVAFGACTAEAIESVDGEGSAEEAIGGGAVIVGLRGLAKAKADGEGTRSPLLTLPGPELAGCTWLSPSMRAMVAATESHAATRTKEMVLEWRFCGEATTGEAMAAGGEAITRSTQSVRGEAVLVCLVFPARCLRNARSSGS
jgi:hypothetical protein